MKFHLALFSLTLSDLVVASWEECLLAPNPKGGYNLTSVRTSTIVIYEVSFDTIVFDLE